MSFFRNELVVDRSVGDAAVFLSGADLLTGGEI